MASDPNAKCTCGYRKFRTTRTIVGRVDSRWLLFDGAGGFGITPFGTSFGSGDSSSRWGLFGVDVAEVHSQLTCERCNRLRSDKVLGSFGLFGSYVFGDSIYVLTTSAQNLGCVSVRFSNSAYGTVDVAPTVFLGTPLPLLASVPSEVANTPPPGAVLATVLRFPLPDVDHDGAYAATFIEACSGSSFFLTTLMLESSVQVHTPREAELDGLPSHLIESNALAVVPVAQPGTGSVMGIPFDKCTAVIEYDSRFGTSPSTQGWTHIGSSGGVPSDYTLIDGGVLNFVTPNPSYWRKSITLSVAPTSLHLYAKYRVQDSTTGLGKGFEVKGIGSPGSLGDFKGVRYFQDRETLNEIDLPNTTSGLVTDRTAGSWTRLYSGDDIANNRAFLLVDDANILPIDASAVFATQPGGGASPQLRAEFGNTQIVGGTLLGQVRNFVLSSNGRFTRAFFRSYAAVAAPVLRMQFVSDLDSTDPKARFLVRYGSLATGSSPYTYGALSVGITAFFNNPKNVMVEVAVTLPSLTALQPFWFSVERDWQHADDLTNATVHLLAATVRSS